MDADFFQGLEESFSNVGADEVWERTVGGHKVLLSPISFTGQGKVQEALTNKDLGANVIGESKRVTLSHAIVGIDGYDLRKFRNGPPVFGPIKMPGGKEVKVDLATYVYQKMGNWGSQFIDDVFTVFADLMETHSKNNVKDVKFENAKNPADELGELMVRVTELRLQLGLPPLVEESKPVDEAEEFEAIQRREAESREAEEEESAAPEPGFDPFKTVRVDPVQPPARPVQPPRSPPPQAAPPPPPAPMEPDPVPVTTLPVAIPPQTARGVQSVAELEATQPTSSPQRPHVAQPSVNDEVIEAPSARVVTNPPVINPKQWGKNPRFNPPNKV